MPDPSNRGLKVLQDVGAARVLDGVILPHQTFRKQKPKRYTFYLPQALSNCSLPSSEQLHILKLGDAIMSKNKMKTQPFIFRQDAELRYIVAFLIIYARIMLIPPSPMATLIILIAIVNILILQWDNVSKKLMFSRTFSALALLFTFELIASPETKPSAGEEGI